jgi:hypothetical protein
MKLAEGLILRADLQTRVQQLRERLVQSALVQEGDTPPEEPSALLADLENTTGELQALIARINATNSTARLEDGRTVTEALAERDVLRLKRSVLESLVQAAAISRSRYSQSEVRFVPMVDVGDLQKQIDALSRKQRDLDITLQSVNWNIDVV